MSPRPPWPPAHALITGGSSGIGLALARRLAGQGTAVSLVARDPARLAAAAAEIGPLARSFPADVLDGPGLAAAMAAAGSADLLVASAGAVRVGHFHRLPEAAFRELMELNYFGVLNTLRAGLPVMRERGAGRALLLGSAGGLVGVWGYAAYAPTKAALASLAAVLRAECRPDGVVVSVAHPPDTDTPQLAAERAERPAETEAVAAAAGVMHPDAVARIILRGLRAGRAEIPVGLPTWALARLAPAVRPALDAWLDRRAARVRRAPAPPAADRAAMWRAPAPAAPPSARGTPPASPPSPAPSP